METDRKKPFLDYGPKDAGRFLSVINKKIIETYCSIGLNKIR